MRRLFMVAALLVSSPALAKHWVDPYVAPPMTADEIRQRDSYGKPIEYPAGYQKSQAQLEYEADMAAIQGRYELEDAYISRTFHEGDASATQLYKHYSR